MSIDNQLILKAVSIRDEYVDLGHFLYANNMDNIIHTLAPEGTEMEVCDENYHFLSCIN